MDADTMAVLGRAWAELEDALGHMMTVAERREVGRARDIVRGLCTGAEGPGCRARPPRAPVTGTCAFGEAFAIMSGGDAMVHGTLPGVMMSVRDGTPSWSEDGGATWMPFPDGRFPVSVLSGRWRRA